MKEIFEKKNVKLTKHRKEVYEFIKKHPSTLKELIDKKATSMDDSTLYRIIDLFLEKEIFLKNIDKDGNVYFTVNENHTHYINCIKCHKKVKINFCMIDNIKDRIFEETGYILTFHNMMLDGICNNCNNHKAA